MTEHLKESEWLVINNILLELYKIDSQSLFMEKVMKVFRMLVPYTKGHFVLMHEDGSINRCDCGQSWSQSLQRHALLEKIQRRWC